MKVRFWGSRGSLPAPLTAEAVRKKILRALRDSRNLSLDNDEDLARFVEAQLPFSVRGTYGGNTSCVEIAGGDEAVLCDAGTGIRVFGNHVLRESANQGRKPPRVFHLFMSHLHWDHLQGFPFFVPAYIPGNAIHIYGFHERLKEAFSNQQQGLHFPMPLENLLSDIRFHVLETDKDYAIAGFNVRGVKQNHPGGSFGYRFERGGKVLVYSTDSEHKADMETDGYAFLSFIQDADLLIFDAQYSFGEQVSNKEDWGHSSNIIAVELSVKAGVKHLCLFHHDPVLDDDALDRFLTDTREYLDLYAGSHPLRIDLAHDGLTIDL
ncbi:MAG TPA: MBL fold metallo-hydrolase [Syntrophobacteraceae bacterium]|nr:MBL fold metallo-hydrolase [Syntrophobacteraceae bacterium]